MNESSSSVFLSIYLSVCLSSVCLSISQFVCQTVYKSVFQTACLSVRLNVEISAIIKTRDIKFAMKVPVNHTQMKLNIVMLKCWLPRRSPSTAAKQRIIYVTTDIYIADFIIAEISTFLSHLNPIGQ